MKNFVISIGFKEIRFADHNVKICNKFHVNMAWLKLYKKLYISMMIKTSFELMLKAKISIIFKVFRLPFKNGSFKYVGGFMVLCLGALEGSTGSGSGLKCLISLSYGL